MGGQGVTAPVSFLITLRGMKNLCVNLKDPSTSLRMTVFVPDGCVAGGAGAPPLQEEPVVTRSSDIIHFTN